MGAKSVQAGVVVSNEAAGLGQTREATAKHKGWTELTGGLVGPKGQTYRSPVILLMWREWMKGGVVGGEGVGGGKGPQTRLSSPPLVYDPQADLHAAEAIIYELLLLARELTFHRPSPVSLP